MGRRAAAAVAGGAAANRLVQVPLAGENNARGGGRGVVSKGGRSRGRRRSRRVDAAGDGEKLLCPLDSLVKALAGIDEPAVVGRGRARALLSARAEAADEAVFTSGVAVLSAALHGALVGREAPLAEER